MIKTFIGKILCFCFVFVLSLQLQLLYIHLNSYSVLLNLQDAAPWKSIKTFCYNEKNIFNVMHNQLLCTDLLRIMFLQCNYMIPPLPPGIFMCC